MLLKGVSPSIFESFNARALKPSQVAKSFVPSRKYEELVRRAHSIVVGPRGSGKTTLLKMLQPQAIESWDHSLADSIRERIDFTGVFVAADIAWSRQLTALGEGKLDEDSLRLFGVAAFTTHTLRSLVKAFLARTSEAPALVRPFRRVKLAASAEARLVRDLAQHWHLEPVAATLLALKHALSARAKNISELASMEAARDPSGRPGRLAEMRFLHINYISASGLAVEIFDDLCGQDDGRWALLCDELELAPELIRRDLLRSLRSTDERFLFKLALSPASPDLELLESSLTASPGNDYDPIPLWYAEKRHGYHFCEQLWEAMLHEKGIEPKDARAALGRSYFETLPSEWVEAKQNTAYRDDSRIGRELRSLAAKDPSFELYLREREIDVTNLDSVGRSQRAAELRKIAPLVPIRDFYRRGLQESGRKQSKRSRKAATLYAGAESLFAISEGNPRWFIGIVSRLLDRADPHAQRIPEALQAREFLAAAERFAAMLRTIPVGYEVTKSSRGLLSLVRLIGLYFHAEAVEKDFTAEPAGSFIVDSNSSEHLLNAVEQALNAGAIVYVPDDAGQVLLKSLRGKRFRLCYLLAPLYEFPLRLGTAVSLANMLREGAFSDPQTRRLPFSVSDREEEV